MGGVRIDNKNMKINWKTRRPWFAFNAYGMAISILSGSFYVLSLYIENIFDLAISEGVVGLVLMAGLTFLIRNTAIEKKYSHFSWNLKWTKDVDILSIFIIYIIISVHLLIAYEIVENTINERIGIIFIAYFLFPWFLFSSGIVKFSQTDSFKGPGNSEDILN